MAQEGSASSASNAPRAAANYVRRSAEAIRAGKQAVGEQISLMRAERAALCRWAELNGKKIPFDFVERFKAIGSGAEHRVYHDQQSGLAIKATRTNSFGHSVFAQDVIATPSEYLRRLAWSNLLLGDEFRILGIAFDEEQIEIVSAHKWIEGHAKRPVPSEDEIAEYFQRFGFARCGSNPDSPLFYNPELRLLLADSHDTNVIRNVDGDCVAIDVVIGYPGPRMRGELGLPGLAISGVTAVTGPAMSGPVQII